MTADLFAAAAAAARQAAENKPGLARADHPATSQAAADEIAPVSGMIRLKVLRMLVAVGPATEEFLSRATEVAGNTVRPRLVELRDDGLVERKGFGLTHAGRRAQLHAITDKGRLALQHHDNQGDKP